MVKKMGLLIFGIVFLFLLGQTQAAAQYGAQPLPVIRYANRHDTSSPLLQMAQQMAAQPDLASPTVLPKFQLPLSTSEDNKSSLDAALQSVVYDAGMPVPLTNFNGLSNVNGVLPPDTQGDIGYDPLTGTKYYVQWVNLSFQIWDVTNPSNPNALVGPVNGNALWSGFGGACETINDGDPITLFDPLAKRWMMSQFALPYYPSGPFYQCIAISQTADPTGAWYRYAFVVHETKMNDYPKFGVWPDAYYMSVNQFQNSSWAGAGVVAFEREKMLSGQQARMVYFDLYAVNPNIGGLLPADLDGLTSPPEGLPGLFASVDDASGIGPLDSIRLWEFDVDWATPQNASFGNPSGSDRAIANAYLPVTSFNLMPSIYYAVPQFNTTVKLDHIGDRAMYRLVYRNFGDYQSLVFNHTVKADGTDRAGVRWYELRNSGTTWTIHQQSTFAPPDDLYRWMGSVAMDHDGNLALGYSLSGTTRYPSIAATGRLSADPLGEMTLGETILMEGGGYQAHSAARWGDYSMMAVDPLDDCTFWYTNEYLPVSSSTGWVTRISAFRYPTCNSGPSGEIQGVIRDVNTGTSISGAVVQVGSYQTVSGSEGNYVLAVPVGTYQVDVSKEGYQPETVTGVVVSDGAVTTLDIDLTVLPTVLMHGLVFDGSGHGWPLYAKITVSSSQSDQVIYTDPFTGMYQISLYQGQSYTFMVEAVLPGYQPLIFDRTYSTTDQQEDISLSINQQICSAPGYGWAGGLAESFDYPTIPDGWQVTDNAGTGAVWTFSPTRDNLTGGSGNFVIADSDSAGFVNMDTSLVSPSVDLSGVNEVVLSFKTDYYHFSVNEFARVELSIQHNDWETIWEKSGGSYRGPVTETIDISATAANQSDVRLRFHYGGAYFSWFWQIDDVYMASECEIIPGGMAAGLIYQADTLDPLDGVQVVNEAGLITSSFTDTEDPLTAGVYFLFQPMEGVSESHDYTALGDTVYPDLQQSLLVLADQVNRLDFPLGGGLLTVTPQELFVSITSDTIHQETLEFLNSGSTPVTVNLGSTLADSVYQSAVIEEPHNIVKPFKQAALTTEKLKLEAGPVYPPYGFVSLLSEWHSGLKQAWAVLPNENQVWVTSPGEGWMGSNALFSYDHNQTLPSSRLNFSWQPLYGPADLAWDQNHQTAWMMNIHDSNQYCIYAINLQTGQTGEMICPNNNGFANAQRGLAYDPVSDTFFAGGWNDGMLYRFNRQGEILQAVWLQQPISGLAYHPVTKKLFAITNEASTRLLVFDTESGIAPLGEMDLSGVLSPYGGAGLEIDCDGMLWAVDQSDGRVIQLDVGEPASVCSVLDVGWLSFVPQTFSVAANSQTTASVQFNTSGMAPGIYHARIQIGEDTPYMVDDVSVNLIVDAHLINWIYLPLIVR
ncbi:MAG: hypothetical protein CL609_17525 [Anaerolineaceae bacterium]|nr:hypothetical protein [Anaerolineaceae bacterium]